MSAYHTWPDFLKIDGTCVKKLDKCIAMNELIHGLR